LPTPAKNKMVGVENMLSGVKEIRPFTAPAPCTRTGLIKVRYGENQTAIFNSKCQKLILLEVIKRRCGCGNIQGGIDLITWKGELQNISQSDHIYADDCLKERESYVLVKVIDDESQPNPQYISLLQNLDKLNPDLAMKLHDLSKPQAREIRAKWASLGKKGIEINGSPPISESPTPTTPKKGLNSILESTGKRGGSKFVDLIAAAVKNKELLTAENSTEEDTRPLRKSSGKKSASSSGRRRVRIS